MIKPRLAVIGVGWWASLAHLPAIVESDSMTLAAVCDPDHERVQEVSRQYGVPAFTNVDELLRAGLADGVVICSPHTTHYSIAVAAFDAGLHVLVEKPMTVSAREAWDLVDIAERSGLHLSVGYSYQFSSTASTIQRLVCNEIGELVCINADFASDTEPLFRPASTATIARDEPSSVAYSDPQLSGGGQGQSQLTHILAMIIWCTQQEATEAYALMSNRGLPVDIVNAVTFRLESGSLAAVTSTGTHAGDLPTRHCVRYYGTKGMIEHDLSRAEAMLYRPDGTQQAVRYSTQEAPYQKKAPARAFARLLRGEGPNLAPGREAAAAVSLVEAAYRSARTGQSVAVTREHS